MSEDTPGPSSIVKKSRYASRSHVLLGAGRRVGSSETNFCFGCDVGEKAKKANRMDRTVSVECTNWR